MPRRQPATRATCWARVSIRRSNATKRLTNKIAGMTFEELAEEYLEKGTAKLRANSTLKCRATALRGKWFAAWRPRPLLLSNRYARMHIASSWD